MARWLPSSPHSHLFSQLPQGKRSSLLLSPTKDPEMSPINTQERNLWQFCKGRRGAKWKAEKGVDIVALNKYIMRECPETQKALISRAFPYYTVTDLGSLTLYPEPQHFCLSVKEVKLGGAKAQPPWVCDSNSFQNLCFWQIFSWLMNTSTTKTLKAGAQRMKPIPSHLGGLQKSQAFILFIYLFSAG